MASSSNTENVLNTETPSNEPNQALISFNVAAQLPLKLNSTNYLSWKLQFHTLLIGYDLFGFIDGSKARPSATITTNNTIIPNPAHVLWIRQDQLILNAIIGSISPLIIPFIAQSRTSREAWTILATTYATPSRGRIKQAKSQLKLITKGSASVTSFLQSIKAKADELALLGAPLHAEDLTDKVLDGLGDEYRELTRAVQARDMPISFEELHEKLLNFEASVLPTPDALQFPATANMVHKTHPIGSPIHRPSNQIGVHPCHTTTGPPFLQIPNRTPNPTLVPHDHTWVIARYVAYKAIQQSTVPLFALFLCQNHPPHLPHTPPLLLLGNRRHMWPQIPQLSSLGSLTVVLRITLLQTLRISHFTHHTLGPTIL